MRERTVAAEQPKPSTNPSPDLSQTEPRILAPVETMLENEIWQYRYPPFDDLFTQRPAKELNSGDDDSLTGVRSTRQQFNIDELPSYVIGILDPAELVDGLFHQPAFGPFRGPDFISSRNAVPESDSVVSNEAEFRNDRFDRDARGPLSEPLQLPKRIFGVPRIILDSDDRWVWSSSF